MCTASYNSASHLAYLSAPAGRFPCQNSWSDPLILQKFFLDLEDLKLSKFDRVGGGGGGVLLLS